MIDKEYYLSKAIEITKEYARGGGADHVDIVLEDVYKKLLELAKDVEIKE